MPIAKTIAEKMSGKTASAIRRMFEEGIELKKIHGEDAVCDFSLGNPDLEPPAEVGRAMLSIAARGGKNRHGYMPNAGYPETRAAMAQKVSGEQGVALSADNIVMTCGAAAALNCVLKAVVEPGDEVVVTAPYFPEYAHYAANHGGILRPVPAKEDFSPDTEGIARILSPKTAAVIVNSPNNPTGRVYTGEDIGALARALAEHGASCGRKPFLISDEPYRDIVYDGAVPAPVFPAYGESVVVSSFAKNLNLPGERIGYAAVNPACADAAELSRALTFANRILGFVNAPAFFQRVVAETWQSGADYSLYAVRRNALMGALDGAGIGYAVPGGAFYLFCKVPASPRPADSDVEFCEHLKRHLVLCAPGSSFGYPGWFRMAYCVAEKTIETSRAALKKAAETWRL